LGACSGSPLLPQNQLQSVWRVKARVPHVGQFFMLDSFPIHPIGLAGISGDSVVGRHARCTAALHAAL
jgi:hypothetical protein